MNQMAGHMDSLLDAQDHARRAANPAMLDEIRMWVAVDPLLADLHKQYLDARINHARLKSKHGDTDPICDVASDMEDSARCAVDTRIIELRQCAESKAALQAIIRKAHTEREAELVNDERARSTQFWREFAVRKVPRVVERAQFSFFQMMVGIIILQQLAAEAHQHLRIADNFCRAAGARRFAASG